MTEGRGTGQAALKPPFSVYYTGRGTGTINKVGCTCVYREGCGAVLCVVWDADAEVVVEKGVSE